MKVAGCLTDMGPAAVQWLQHAWFKVGVEIKVVRVVWTPTAVHAWAWARATACFIAEVHAWSWARATAFFIAEVHAWSWARATACFIAEAALRLKALAPKG